MPAPSKSLKNLYATVKSESTRVGVLARAINAVEGCLTPTNHDENTSDTTILRDMLLEEAESVYSKWIGALKSHQILTIINKELEDSGWDTITFCVNHDEDDPTLITWFTEE